MDFSIFSTKVCEKRQSDVFLWSEFLSDLGYLTLWFTCASTHEPRHEKNQRSGFRPVPTQTRLYSYTLLRAG